MVEEGRRGAEEAGKGNREVLGRTAGPAEEVLGVIPSVIDQRQWGIPEAGGCLEGKGLTPDMSGVAGCALTFNSPISFPKWSSGGGIGRSGGAEGGCEGGDRISMGDLSAERLVGISVAGLPLPKKR
jgi:hypothetical protein